MWPRPPDAGADSAKRGDVDAAGLEGGKDATDHLGILTGRFGKSNELLDSPQFVDQALGLVGLDAQFRGEQVRGDVGCAVKDQQAEGLLVA